jgi:RES domain-containing protein
VKNLGDAWVREERSLVLKVPSAVVPSEYNYLINPNHPDARRLEVSPPFDPQIDPRFS